MRSSTVLVLGAIASLGVFGACGGESSKGDSGGSGPEGARATGGADAGSGGSDTSSGGRARRWHRPRRRVRRFRVRERRPVRRRGRRARLRVHPGYSGGSLRGERRRMRRRALSERRPLYRSRRELCLRLLAPASPAATCDEEATGCGAEPLFERRRMRGRGGTYSCICPDGASRELGARRTSTTATRACAKTEAPAGWHRRLRV